MSEQQATFKKIKRFQIPKQAVDQGTAFLENYFKLVNADVSISTQVIKLEDGEECIYTLSGELKPLRRQQQFLASLNRLTSMAMNAGGRQRHLCQIDLDGDLYARQALLQVIAEDAAAVVKHTHKRAVIEGLSAGERRQIHHHITVDEEVETLSDGEDEFRYLMVALKT